MRHIMFNNLQSQHIIYVAYAKLEIIEYDNLNDNFSICNQIPLNVKIFTKSFDL